MGVVLAKAKEAVSSTTPRQTPSHENEPLAWQFFISQGFTREQTAGIMGNLRQEHNYKTDDVPGGLGIAQWLSSRRDRLMAEPSYLSLSTQLNFIVRELNTTEARAGAALKQAASVEAATIAFQDLYERCGDCRQSQRIQYAKEILMRY